MFKERLARWIAAALARAGFLPRIFGFAGRWSVGRSPGGRPEFPYLARRARRQFQILLYHRVNDTEDPFFDTVSAGAFEAQMALLERCCSVLPLAEAVERSGANDLPPNAVVITFDDGYADNYESAFPILKRLGLPATIFLTTGPVDSQELLWHDRLIDAFRESRAPLLEWEGASYPLKTRSQKGLALRACLRVLRRCDPAGRDERVRRLGAALGVGEPQARAWRKLTWGQIAEMAGDGISFGAHTVTHPILTRIPLPEAVDEIVRSREAIESRLGGKVDLFAYPNGGRDDYDENIKRAVREAGFRCAATALPGANDSRTDSFELRRDTLWDPSPATAMLRLAWSRLSS
jgi:peptidoglycan/xylan/chitin deacetylase (PgdA/CDA1 family)